MKWRSTHADPDGWAFVIEDMQEDGFRLWVYDRSGRNTHDYLQDSFYLACRCAEKLFHVPLDGWQALE